MMKIVYVRSYFSSFKTFYDYVEEAFERAGHKVYPFDYRSYKIPSLIRERSTYLQNVSVTKINKDFIKFVDEIKPDLLFFSHGFTILYPTIVKLKKKHKCIAANWLCDYPRDFEIAHEYAPLFDYFFVSSTDALKRLRLAGHKNIYYILFACDPNYQKPLVLSTADKQKYSSDICFVGSMYPGRVRMFEKISDFDISIWGPRWEDITKGSALKALVRGSSLDTEEWVKAFSGAKIVLNNISSFAPYVDNMMNTRIFEILACNAFQLVDTRDDILMHFTSGSELVCYSSIEELRKLLNYYLYHKDEAREIAANGYKKVIYSHTYDHRIKEIQEIINRPLT